MHLAGPVFAAQEAAVTGQREEAPGTGSRVAIYHSYKDDIAKKQAFTSDKRAILRQRTTDGLRAPVPVPKKLEPRLSEIPRKARAVIGMRRSGTSTVLR
jgi:hypothetical protein